MASYHVEIKSGHKGVAAEHSTYIAREGWHRHKGGLMFSGYGNMPPWAELLVAKFWRAADRYERANGATYRELIIALPHELNMEQLRALVDRLISELVGARPYQYAVHASKSSLQGEYNPHLHLMYSDRLPDGIDRSAEKLFSRYNPADPAMGGRKKGSGGMTRAEIREDLVGKRRAVAEIQNEFLASYGHEDRVDHRSLKEQGLAREAERHLGPARIKGMSDEEKARYAALRNEAKVEED
jgi:hypothetical protein